jgi:hypothetical protein
MVEHRGRIVDVPRVDLARDAILQDLEGLEDDVVSRRAHVEFGPLSRLCLLHDAVERNLRGVQGDAPLRNDVLHDPKLLLNEVAFHFGAARLVLRDSPIELGQDFLFLEIVELEQDIPLIHLEGHLRGRGLYLRRLWRFNRDRHVRFPPA